MADNIDPQQFDDLNKNLEKLIETLGGTAAKSAGVNKALSDQLGISKEAMQGFSQLGTSATDLTKSLYKGEQGAKAFGKSIDGVSNAIDTFANMLIAGLAFINPLAAAGVFLTKTLVKGAIDYGKAAGEMGDKLYDSYSALSRAGAAGQQGMSGVYTSMKQFAYGIDELDKMLALVKENSKSLALFSGTVVDGMGVLSNTAETIQRSGLQTQLLKMGVSVDGINHGIAGYYNQLGRLGQLQGKTQSDLTAGTYAYLVEMEGLARLTGQERQEMEKQRQEANLIDQFLAQARKMGDRGQDAYNIFNTLYAASPTIAKQFASQFSGFMTEESAQIFQATGGDVRRLSDDFKAGRIEWTKVVTGIGAAYDKSLPLIEDLALLQGANKDQFGSLNDAIAAAELKTKDFTKAVGQTKPIDGLTGSAVTLRQNQMASRDAMQDFVRLGVGPATEALNGLAVAAKGMSTSLPGNKGTTPVGGDVSGGWLRDLLGLGPSKVTGKSGDLLDLIAKGESGGNYNQLVTINKKAGLPSTANLTEMTIDQVQKMQSTMRAQGYESSAVGKYQIIEATLRNAAKQLNLDTSKTKFDQKTQDLIASYLIEQRTQGRDVNDALIQLNKEWPSLPKDISSQTGKELAKFLSGQPSSAKPTGPTDRTTGAATPAGPTSGYKPSVENAKPGETTTDEASAATRFNDLANNASDDSAALQQMLVVLQEQNAILRDQLSVQEKTRQAVQ